MLLTYHADTETIERVSKLTYYMLQHALLYNAANNEWQGHA